MLSGRNTEVILRRKKKCISMFQNIVHCLMCPGLLSERAPHGRFNQQKTTWQSQGFPVTEGEAWATIARGTSIEWIPCWIWDYFAWLGLLWVCVFLVWIPFCKPLLQLWETSSSFLFDLSMYILFLTKLRYLFFKTLFINWFDWLSTSLPYALPHNQGLYAITDEFWTMTCVMQCSCASQN